MGYIRIETNLIKHPKTMELANLIGLDVLYAAAHLMSLWIWIFETYPDGAIPKKYFNHLEYAGMWKGKKGVFADALLTSGYIDETETEYVIHDWFLYSGQYVERKRKNAERNQKNREQEEEKPQQISLENDIKMTSKQHIHNVATMYAHIGEERREEESIGEKSTEINFPQNSETIPVLSPVGDDICSDFPPETESPIEEEKPQKKKSASKSLSHYSDEFLTFWEVYPKKASKGSAFAEWKKLRPPKELQEVMIRAVQSQKPGWDKDNNRFTPEPGNWLKKRKWEDEVKKEAVNGSGNYFAGIKVGELI